MKTKLQSLVIISLFLVTMAYINTTNISETDLVNDQADYEPKPNPYIEQDFSLNNPSRSVIDYNTWYESETIKTDIEFNKGSINYEYLSTTINFDLDYEYWLGFGNELVDASGALQYQARTPSVSASRSETIYIMSKMYCGGSGTLTYSTRFVGGNFVAYAFLDTGTTSSTYDVTNLMLDTEGYLNLVFEFTVADDSPQDWVRYYIKRIHEGQTTIVTDTESPGSTTSYSGFDYWQFYMYKFYFIRDTITSNVRSEVKYNSPTTKTHRVNPPSVTFAKEMNIYYNGDEWTYSSITPTASVTDSSGVLTVNSPTEINYEVLFTSNCSNHLAIKDVSEQYFSDVGFEGGTYQNDFSEQSGYDWDSMSISTEKFYEGYYSVELENTVASRSIISIDALEGRIRNFYFQISVYYETITSGSLYIYYSSDAGWTSISIDNTILNKWQTVQIFVDNAEYNGVKGYFRIDTLSGTNFEGKAFIDNIKILETSTTIKTTQSSESQIDFDSVLFDGYKFAQDSFRDYQVEIWDRTAQTLEHSYSVTTDEFGRGTVIHPHAFEQKEYEIRVYTLDSYFGSVQTQTDVTNSLTDWTLANEDTGTETASCVDSTIIFEFRELASCNWEIQYNPTSLFDISSADILYYTYRTNVTGISNYKWIRTDGSNHILNQTDQPFTANTVYHMVDSFRHADYVETGSFDDTQIDIVYLREASALGWIKVEIFDFRFINAQKLYFTPSYPTETDYAETILNDAWDFSEGDKEGFTESVGAQNLYVDDGLFHVDITGTGVYTRIRSKTTLSIDTDKYYTFLISAYGSESGLKIKIADSGNNILTDYITLTTIKTTYEIVITSGYWTGTETNFYIWFYDSSGDFEGAEDFYFDFVRLVHVDDPVLYETDTSFYLSSASNDYSYEIYSDETYLGVYSDLQTILKNNTVGDHNLTYVLFSAGEETAYLSSTYEYLYNVDSASFTVSVENFYLSDLYINTYVTSNYDGQYYVYKDNAPDGSGTLSAIGTTISTSRDLTVGVTIAYAIKFVNDTSTIWFNTTYSNPSQDFFITDYRINTTAPNIIITWDTSKNTIDSLTSIEDGVVKATDDPTSTTSWTKSTEVGTHYVTLIFSATNFDDIIYSFTYTVVAIEEFQVDVENVYPSDDYLSIYCTSNYDYSYETYTNGTPSGSGNGLSVGTFIIIPKETTAGIFNLTVAFVYGAETVLFMTWYSNLIPPPEPNTDIYREQSEGFFNISFITNLDHFWIDIYHDSVLIVDDSTLTAFSIAKDTLIGWHNVSLVLIYNCTTNSDGYPVAEYNETVTYPLFWYETVLFYDCQIRYTEKIYGIAVPEIDVDSVLTYLNGVLVDTLNYTSVIQEHSNYSYILNNRLWIHNSARNHRLVVRDLFDNLIYNVSIDIGIIQSMTIELPLEKLYVINLDNDDRMIKIRPYLSGLDWDTDADDLITMILGQYESKSYWVIDSTYECRIYKKVESVSDGVTLWYWLHDPNVEPPPERVPFSITIPLVTDDDDDGEKTWWDKVVDFFVQYWFYIALVLLLIVLLISYNAIGNAIVKKLEKTIREGKKPSLFAETFLQLLWSSKYDRLVGYKRGKQK